MASWLCVTEKRMGHGRPVVSKNVVNVYAFSSKEERDSAVTEYRPPSHCPSAFAEAVTAKDPDVKSVYYGSKIFHIAEKGKMT